MGTYTSKGREVRKRGLRGGDSAGPRSGPPDFLLPRQYARAVEFQNQIFSWSHKNNVTRSLNFAVEITPVSVSAGASPHTPTERTTLSQGLLFGWLGVLVSTCWRMFAVGFWTHFSSWFPSIWSFSLTWDTDRKLRRHFVFTSYNIYSLRARAVPRFWKWGGGDIQRMKGAKKILLPLLASEGVQLESSKWENNNQKHCKKSYTNSCIKRECFPKQLSDWMRIQRTECLDMWKHGRRCRNHTAYSLRTCRPIPRFRHSLFIARRVRNISSSVCSDRPTESDANSGYLRTTWVTWSDINTASCSW